MGRHVAWIVWSLLAVLMMGCGNDVPRVLRSSLNLVDEAGHLMIQCCYETSECVRQAHYYTQAGIRAFCVEK